MPHADPEKRAEYKRKHYQKNKSLWSKRDRRKRAAVKEYRDAWKRASGCLFCKKTAPEIPLSTLHFHHVDKRTKRGKVSDARSLKWLKEEIKKCVVLCVTCHHEHHVLKDDY